VYTVKSGSKWTWLPCQSFISLSHHQHLNLQQAPGEFLPAEQAFLRMPEITEAFVSQQPANLPRQARAIEDALTAIGYGDEDLEEKLGKAYAANNRQLVREFLARGYQRGSIAEKIKEILIQSEKVYFEKRIVDLSEEEKDKERARLREQRPVQKRTEGKIDLLAMALARLCGLTIEPFGLDARKPSFRFAGQLCETECDVYIVTNATNELVIIFEDKSGKFGNHGYLGQIVCELLMCFSDNLIKGFESRRVFCLRVFQHYVTAFAMTATTKQINAVCEDSKVPNPLIDLCSTVADPTVEANGGKGLDLFVPAERAQIINLLARIRHAILQQRANTNNNNDDNNSNNNNNQ